MGGWCIDSTEVTVSQYSEFLTAKNGDTSNQGLMCTDNTSFEPHLNEVAPYYCYASTNDKPNRPIRCIDWCDARAFCQWAGKRLCGVIGGGSVKPLSDDEHDPATNQWIHACSNGGTTQFPYGDVFDTYACIIQLSISDTFEDVKSAPDCHGLQEPYRSVYDMSGNVGEWIDACGSTSCASHGGNIYSNTIDLDCYRRRFLKREEADSMTGFRCCSQP